MVLMSRETDYALRALAELAISPGLVSVRVLADRTGIPTNYLRKIMQRLLQNRLVTSRQGPFGGYRLRRNPRAITFRQVMEAAGGRIDVSACRSDPELCPHVPTCALRKQLMKLQGEIDGWTTRRKLADIVLEPQAAGSRNRTPSS